ncbi:serine protease, partial [Enterococcus faecium]
MKKRLFASVLLCALTLSAIATPSIALADNVDKKIEEKNQEISSLKARQGDLA